MENFEDPSKILFESCTNLEDFVATRFFQELVVSSGKKSESLQDPDHIWQGSCAETSKIFPRVNGKNILVPF